MLFFRSQITFFGFSSDFIKSSILLKHVGQASKRHSIPSKYMVCKGFWPQGSDELFLGFSSSQMSQKYCRVTWITFLAPYSDLPICPWRMLFSPMCDPDGWIACETPPKLAFWRGFQANKQTNRKEVKADHQRE